MEKIKSSIILKNGNIIHVYIYVKNLFLRDEIKERKVLLLYYLKYLKLVDDVIVNLIIISFTFLLFFLFLVFKKKQ